jgi:hypothetical protein
MWPFSQQRLKDNSNILTIQAKHLSLLDNNNAEDNLT